MDGVKIGVLSGSILSAFIGYLLLFVVTGNRKKK
jgi:Na+/H+ antiporter NhaA